MQCTTVHPSQYVYLNVQTPVNSTSLGLELAKIRKSADDDGRCSPDEIAPGATMDCIDEIDEELALCDEIAELRNELTTSRYAQVTQAPNSDPEPVKIPEGNSDENPGPVVRPLDLKSCAPKGTEQPHYVALTSRERATSQSQACTPSAADHPLKTARRASPPDKKSAKLPKMTARRRRLLDEKRLLTSRVDSMRENREENSSENNKSSAAYEAREREYRLEVRTLTTIQLN